MNKRLAFVHRFSLKDFAPGWGDECYIDYIPASYKDAAVLVDLDDDLPETEQAEQSTKFMSKHIVGGKVYVLGDDGDKELADFSAEQAEELPLAAQKELVAAIMGRTLDPKVSAESGEKPPSAADVPTET